MLADSSWATEREGKRGVERGREREMELRREGRQWQNTGLTIKTAQSVVFEGFFCSSNSLFKPAGEETGLNTRRLLRDFHFDIGLLKQSLLLWLFLVNYLSLCYSFNVTLPLSCPLSFIVKGAGADHTQSSALCGPAGCQTGAESGRRHRDVNEWCGFDDWEMQPRLVCIYALKLPSAVHMPNDRRRNKRKV